MTVASLITLLQAVPSTSTVKISKDGIALYDVTGVTNKGEVQINKRIKKNIVTVNFTGEPVRVV